ncbi:MAG TPA: choice-of-anchor D domain-containing protein, partial [Candidatus Dormibacteraeota bacterium]|nr:choice-of-anchor D domain-containing protein [Candidatus Dormibacteraeota bacterium]
MTRRRIAVSTAALLIATQFVAAPAAGASPPLGRTLHVSGTTITRHAVQDLRSLPRRELAGGDVSGPSRTDKLPKLELPMGPAKLGHSAGVRPTPSTVPPAAPSQAPSPRVGVNGASGPPYSFIVVDGGSIYLEAPSDSIQSSPSAGASIMASGPHGTLSLDLAGPDGAALIAGTTYTDVTVDQTERAGHASMGLGYRLGDGSQYYPVGIATVTVHEFTSDGTKATSLSVSFAVALAAGGSVTGELRYNALARRTYPALAVLAMTGMGSTNIGDVAVGIPHAASVTFQNMGTGALSVGAATITGANAGDLFVTGSDCPATLAVDSVCTVQLSYTALASGERFTTLVVAAGVPGGSIHLERRATAYNPITIHIVGSGDVTGYLGPQWITCDQATSPCQYLLYGQASLGTTASGGSTFGGWTGDCSGAGTCTLTWDAPRDVTATFVAPVMPGVPGVQASAGFLGFDDTTPGCTIRPCSPPPEPSIAASPTQFVHGVTGALAIIDRATGFGFGVNATDFFADPTVTHRDNDVRVLWDQGHQRWYASDTGWTCVFGHVDVAVSETADAMGAWTVYQQVLPSTLPAQASLGMSADKIVVGLGRQGTEPGCISGPMSPTALVLNLADALVSPGSLSASLVTLPGTGPLTVSDPPSSDAYIITSQTSGTDQFVDLVTVSGLNGPGPAVPTATAVLVDTLRPLQASGSPTHPTHAVWNGGHIWTLAPNSCMADDSLLCLRADRIDLADPAHPTVGDGFEVGGRLNSAPPGSIGVAADGTVFVTYRTWAGSDSQT